MTKAQEYKTQLRDIIKSENNFSVRGKRESESCVPMRWYQRSPRDSFLWSIQHTLTELMNGFK